MRRVKRLGLFVILLFALDPSPLALSAQLPSLFRGVVVADSAAGVRVVSVEESSQAYLADLRPEDVIVRVQETELRTIEDLAALSTALKGQATSAAVLVFRNGAPRELTLHLYSYPVLRAWGLKFIPQHDIRFAEPPVGFDYWVRLGDGFIRADKPAEAVNAYLNGLHNVPDDVPTALKVSELLVRLSRERLAAGELSDGAAQLHRALLVMKSLFTHPLSTEQLESVKRQLTEALRSLKEASVSLKTGGGPRVPAAATPRQSSALGHLRSNALPGHETEITEPKIAS